jgi:hypothetical protein
MWTFVKRAVPPIFLLLAGVVSLVYGTLWHTAIVHTEEEVDIEIAIPTPFGPLGPFDESRPDDPYFPSESYSSTEEHPSFLEPGEPQQDLPDSADPSEDPFAGEGPPPSDSADPFENPFESGTSSQESPFDLTDPSENPFEGGSDPDEEDPSDEINPFENPFSSGADPPFDTSSAEQQRPSDTPSAGEEQLPFETLPLDATSDGAPDLFALPEPPLEKVTETRVIPKIEPEWVVVREVTFGGVMRLASGELKRTYSGQPPALCPT